MPVLPPGGICRRWEILSKVHHSMLDGIGGADLMAEVFGPRSVITSATPRCPSPAELSSCITWRG